VAISRADLIDALEPGLMELFGDVDASYTKKDTTAGVLHKKWRGLQDKDLQFLWVSTAVKKINKDRYTLIARQIETYLKERNTHEL
jgi:hypothetical protein